MVSDTILSAMSAEKDARAAKLFLAALSVEDIKQQVGFRDVRAAEAAIRRGLAAGSRGKAPDVQRAAEAERLDMLYRAAYPKALKGDLVAVDKCLRISEARVRLAGIASRGESVLTESFDQTVTALKTEPEDVALIASGRRIAERIDTAAASGDALAETKALYLLPHLINILRELGATPAARADLKEQAPNGNTDKSAKLRALRGGKLAAS